MNNDLISRSALLEEFRDFKDMDCPSGHTITADYMIEYVEDAPAVDAEVVRHGRWIAENIRKKSYLRQCSACSKIAYFCGTGCSYNYCPNCGAKMDGKECVPRKCGTCSNDGWDMPQCRECNEENGFKWYKHKRDAEVEG